MKISWVYDMMTSSNTTTFSDTAHTNFSATVGSSTTRGDQGFIEEESHPVLVADRLGRIPITPGTSGFHDKGWTYADTLAKPQPIGWFPWTTADSVGSPLAYVTLPWGALASEQQRKAYASSTFFSGTVHLKVSMNTTRFDAGRLLVFYIPGVSWQEAIANTFISGPRATALNHATIDASSSNTVDITCDMRSVQNKIVFRSGITNSIAETSQTMGTLVVAVLNELKVQTDAVSTKYGYVEAWFDDVELSVPSFLTVDDLPDITSFSNLVQSQSQYAMRKKLQKAKGELNSGITEPDPGVNLVSPNPVASSGAPVINITNSNTEANTDSVSDETQEEAPAQTDSGSGGFFKGLLDSFGPIGDLVGMFLDFPNKFYQDSTFIRHPFGHLPNGRQIAHHQVMDVNPEPIHKPTAYTEHDEMDLSHLLSRPTLLTQFDWDKNDDPGTILVDLPLSIFDSVNPADWESTSLPTNLLDYISLPFEFWNGSLKFSLQIVVNAVATGRIFVTYVPDSLPDEEISGFIDLTSKYTAIIDLANENREYTYTIPYIAETDRKRVMHSEYSTAFEESGYTGRNTFLIGRLIIGVLVPLQPTTGSPDTATLNLFSAAGANYSPSYLAWGSNMWIPAGLKFTVPIGYKSEKSDITQMVGELNSGENQDTIKDAPTPANMPDVQEDSVVLGPISSGHSAHPDNASITPYLGDICKRFSPLSNCIPLDGDNDQPFGHVSYQMFPVGPGYKVFQAKNNFGMSTGPFLNGPVDYYSQLYRFWSGHWRYKLFFSWNRDTVSKSGTGASDIAENMWRPFAVFFPNPPPDIDTDNIGAALSVMLNLWPKYLDSTDGGGQQFRYINNLPLSGTTIQCANISGCVGPICMSDVSTAPYLEIEIPYTSPYRSLYVSSNHNTDIPFEQKFLGTLVVGAITSAPPNESDRIAAEAVNVQVLSAPGDSFRFHTFIGQPRIFGVETANTDVSSTQTYTGQPFPSLGGTAPASSASEVKRARSTLRRPW